MDMVRFAQVQVKYARGFEAAKTAVEKRAVRDEYERDVNELVHGKRLTTNELMAGRTLIQ